MAGSRLLVGIFLWSACIISAQAFNGFGQEIDGYIKESAQRYRVSESMLRGLIKMEDGWYGKRSPTGALGVGQFTQKTWNWLARSSQGKAIGMRLITTSNRGTRSDPRYHQRINTFATALLARWHLEQFALRGIKPTDEHLYLAHNLGVEGLHRALLGQSTAEDIKNMRLNGMKKGMSVSSFIAYQKGRYQTHKYLANAPHQREQEVIWITSTDNQIVWISPPTTF
ncbi:MAG: hypothetical protein SOX56_09785 [[Pasteurella] mairii]|uniref:Putative lysozyme-like superfamily n=1 Tax=[Pasteurella] mairii TaxID=757 RepID=A0A379B735_9PAST|nr:hypothetical protein [[Pasteurella] mairii]SUB34465.1 putative lysozyme-like superfamily [[Pasteurella] mairii]